MTSMSARPFGSKSARFTQNGVHPNMLYRGRMPYDSLVTAPAGSQLGPGSYDLEQYGSFSDKNVSRSVDGPSWQRALYTESLAKMPNILYQEEHYKKLEDKRRLGPGHYEFIDSFQRVSNKPQSNRGMLDALYDRFSYQKPSENPGPFEYGIPDTKLEQNRKNKPGLVPSFERSKEPRSLPLVGSEVPPATYSHKNSIDELCNKKVSKRGPYDLFSENRSGPVKWGHFWKDPTKTLGPGQYDLKTFVDDVKHGYYGSHDKHGKFSKNKQYPNPSGERLACDEVSLHPRKPDWPGPGHYDDIQLSKFPSNPPPFNASAVRDDKRYTKRFNHDFNKCGVGRYDITNEKQHAINSHQSLFRSKTSQISIDKDKPFREERLKPHLNMTEKLNLYSTGNAHGKVSV